MVPTTKVWDLKDNLKSKIPSFRRNTISKEIKELKITGKSFIINYKIDEEYRIYESMAFVLQKNGYENSDIDLVECILEQRTKKNE